MPAPTVVERFIPWLLRAMWIAVLVAGGAAVDSATAASSDTVGTVARYASFSAWLLGVFAMAVASVVSLTAVRLVVPLAPATALVALIAGADAVDGVIFLVASVLTTVVAFSADLGCAFVQASAYGEEDRHLLRPPAAYAMAAITSWVIWAAAAIAAPLLLAHENWVLGVPIALCALAGAALGWPRWHRLARRWFVVVPIGIVIHDQLVLAETVMLRRQELAGIRLAPADTEAADLTGPASGHALEITTTEPTTAIYAATPKQPRGTAIHMRACLVAPSRPGRALGAVAARRLPVG